MASTGLTPTRPPLPAEPPWRRHPLARFGLPFLAIAAIAGAILLLSGRPGDRGNAESEALRAANLGALEPGAPQKGQPAPDFALRTLEGNVVRLSDLRGKIVLVNFWATWCGPCRAEMPDIQNVSNEHKDDLLVLAVNVEGRGMDEARTLAGNFRDELGLTFAIVLDSPDGDVFNQYTLDGLPDSFFVDRDGILRELSYGPMNRDTILNKLAAARGGGS